MKRKKIAIVSDVMMSIGGAEMVVMKLMEMYPAADFYTLFISPKALKGIEERFPKINVRTSIFQRIIKGDNVSKYVSIIKLISWMYWELLDLSRYDLVISSSHSFMSKNVKKGKGAKHLSYIHTPPRYLYDEFNEIGWIKTKPWSLFFWPWKKILRYVDWMGAKRPDVMMANSVNVAKRIEKYYGRVAVVVYPPVGGNFGVRKGSKKDNYFVCLSRLVRQKGIDLAVSTCSFYKIPLIVVGKGGEISRLRNMADTCVEFVEECDDKLKFKILANAKALIYTSKEEDFGMVPIEALKLGTPVIAYMSGGVVESVVDGVNGILYKEFNKVSLYEAIKKFNKKKISRQTCISSVRKFSDKVFEKKIRDYVDNE